MTNLEIFYKILDFLPNETYFRSRTTKVSSMENEYDRELSSLTLQSNNFCLVYNNTYGRYDGASLSTLKEANFS